jgi:similar to stage IV sporulation protein
MRNTWKEWVEGHITITVRGKRFERLLNMAVREGIQIWNIRRVQADVSRCDILIRDYFRLRPLLKETGCRTHVEQRGGLPFWLIRMRGRSGFTAGALVFLFGLYMLSTFVWTVEVQGTKQIPPEVVSEAAEKIGIKEGAWKVKLKEPQILQRELLGMLPEASWVGVDIQGTKAIIQVVEKDEPKSPQATGPRNLVAKKRAVVHSVIAEAGKPMVSVNQFVEKGQVLVSGIIGNEMRQSAVAARGKVQGEVWYVSNITLPLRQVTYQYTGEKQQKQYLVLGPYAIQVWPLREEPFARFEAKDQRYQLTYDNFTLPVSWKTVTLLEMQPVERKLSMDEAVEAGKKVAREDVLARAGEDAVIKDEKVLHVKAENGKVYVSMHFSIIENIAVEQPIVVSPPAPAPNGN